MRCARAAIVLVAAGVVLLAAPVAAAMPQARPGEVAGRVVDFDETPLPGIEVQLHGPFPENTRRTAITDGNARFVFAGVPPGRYRLSIAFPDLSAASNVDVTVNAGQRTETTLVLSLQGTGVNVIVQAEAPAIADTDLADSESTSGLRIVPGTTIQNMPLPAEQALEVLPLLPTVVRSPKGELAIDGTLPTDSVLLFNGIDLMDGYSGDYQVRLPVEAIDVVDVYTGVAPASYGNIAGGIVDITTLAGGESWEWGVASPLPRPRFQNGTLQGIGNASPRLRFSGPIKPGKTYLSVAGEYHFDRVDVYDIPGDPAQDHVRQEGWNTFAQVDWRPQQRHAFKIAGLVFPNYDKWVGLDGLTPPEATLNVERDAEAILGNYTFRIDANRSLETTLQFNRIGVRTEPQGPDAYVVSPDGFGGNHFHIEDRETSHFQGRVTYRRRFPGAGASSHVLQVGGDVEHLFLNGVYDDGVIEVRGAQQQLLQRIVLKGDGVLEQGKDEWALFVQDRWTHSERFWCDFGLRYSSDSFAGDHRLAPRVGAAWDPVGDRRTLLKAAAGIVYRRSYLGEMAWEQLPTRIETTFTPSGQVESNRVLVPRVADDLDTPRTLQFSADASHRLQSGWIFRARYSYRETDHNMIFDRIESGATGTMLLSSSGEASAWSVELTAARRIPSGGEFVVSYVRSSSFGDLNDFRLLTANAPEPIIRPNVRALRSLDTPDRIVAWGTLKLPSEILLTPVIEWRTGFPYSVFAEDQSYAGVPNGERFSNFLGLDLQATKAFEIKGYRITGGVKISNITSHDNPRQVVANTASDQFGEFRNSVPIRVRAKFSFGF